MLHFLLLVVYTAYGVHRKTDPVGLVLAGQHRSGPSSERGPQERGTVLQERGAVL